MDKAQLHELAEDFLQKIIPGAVLDRNSIPSVSRDKLVAQPDDFTIYFKAQKEDRYGLVLRRKQPFKSRDSGTITESHVVEAFVSVVGRMAMGLSRWYKADLRSTFPRRVVAKALCQTKQQEETILTAIDQLSSWAGQQYEGKPIPAAIGFMPVEQTGSVSFRDFSRQPFSAVISNGYDTILTCNFSGYVLGHETLELPEGLKPPRKCPAFAPFRLRLIANWANAGRIALVLNRAGEILVFRDGQLRFTRRGGDWHFLTHNPVLEQMARPDLKVVRRAVYSTCLDASFARTGACIGIVTPDNAPKWRETADNPDDYLSPAISKKTKVLKSVIGTDKFQDLPRQLRQELVAIDGATLMDHEGTILAVGAIVNIEGGSEDGGRLAAAIALSELGVGIKVSQDGQITGFHDGNGEPQFVVM
jgi:hypothetical protein